MASSGSVIWPLMDSHGVANPPEKRKVGSSILSLTSTLTSVGQFRHHFWGSLICCYADAE